jgi:DNA-binding protein H-NS
LVIHRLFKQAVFILPPIIASANKIVRRPSRRKNMSKVDLSSFSLDELTALIDEATNLRTTKYEDRRRELMEELNSLEKQMGKGDKSGGVARPNAAVSAASRRSGPVPTHEGPEGETWAGRGAIPKWSAKYGVTTREGMEKFRIKK